MRGGPAVLNGGCKNRAAKILSRGCPLVLYCGLPAAGAVATSVVKLSQYSVSQLKHPADASCDMSWFAAYAILIDGGPARGDASGDDSSLPVVPVVAVLFEVRT